MKKVNKIAVLGGSFDPPTLSHLQIASEAINTHNFDEVWIVPCGNRPDKKSKSDGKHILNMVNLAIKDVFPDDFPVYVNDIEIQNGDMIGAYHLIKLLQETYGDQSEFHFIIGSDLIQYLKYWIEAEKVVNEIKFVVCNRLGYDIEQYK